MYKNVSVKKVEIKKIGNIDRFFMLLKEKYELCIMYGIFYYIS